MNALLLLMIPLLVSGPWEPTGPEGGEIKAILQSTQDTDVLYALSGDNPTQVVKSLNSGTTWTAISDFTGSTVSDMVMTEDGALVAFGYSRTWVSYDGGITWTTHNQTYINFYDAVPHPVNGGEILATGYKSDGSPTMSLFHSTDHGSTWSDLQLISSGNNSYGRCIDISTGNPDNILVGGYEYSSGNAPCLFLSTDGGSSFADVTPAAASGEYYFYGVGIHPVNPDTLLAGTLSGIYRSTDGGSSWTRIQNQYYGYDISFSDVDPNLVLSAGTYGRTYVSTDCGASWTTTYTGIDGDNIKWVETDALNSPIAYTGSTIGFFHSSDGGNSWNMQNTGLLLGSVMAMEYVNGYIFMNMEDLGVFRTEEGFSVVWEEVTTPLSCGDFCAIESNDADTLLALEGAG